jgi:hypothetical protein
MKELKEGLMAKIDAKVMREMDEQIETLKRGIETAGEEGRSKLKGVNADMVRQGIPRKDRTLDESAWNGLPDNQQRELHRQFVQIRDSLRTVAEPDGPGDAKHIMHDDYAGNAMIVLWAVIGLLLTGFLLSAIASRRRRLRNSRPSGKKRRGRRPWRSTRREHRPARSMKRRARGIKRPWRSIRRPYPN